MRFALTRCCAILDPCSHTQGAVGNDEFATRMEGVARTDGMAVNYLRVDDKPTGKCAVLIVDRERSLVASLGAAESYKVRPAGGCRAGRAAALQP